MSGGYFSYRNDEAKEAIFGCYVNETTVPNVFGDREISSLVFDVFNLIHAYDWYMCGDSGKDSWLKKKKAFKDKWFKKSESDRAKELIDVAIRELREDLYETFGVEEGIS